MRIAVWHNLPSGGGKRALHDHVRGLAMRGHHVESWSPPTADLSYMPLGQYGPEHVVPFDWEPVEYRGPVGRRLKSYRNVTAKIAAMERHARRCVEEMEARGFDVILGNSCSLFATPFLARFAKVPTVLYLQEPFRGFYEAREFWGDLTRQEWVAPKPRPTRRRPPMGWSEQARSLFRDLAEVQAIRVQAREESLNAHAFDRILCNSRFSRESILRIYGRDCEVCYLGIDTDAFRPSESPKERYVVGLGSFTGNKGIDFAIKAIATIDPALRPDLLWIGNFDDPPYFRHLTELAATTGVNFVPKRLVSQEELVELLGRAAVMIYTSRLEPFGYAPLEANASGTAAVGVAEGGIRESIEHGVNGLLVDGGNPAALGEAITRYLVDLDWARDEGLRAREHVLGNWRVEAAVDRLEMQLAATLHSANRAGSRREG